MPDDTANVNRAQAIAALPEMVALAERVQRRHEAKERVIEAAREVERRIRDGSQTLADFLNKHKDDPDCRNAANAYKWAVYGSAIHLQVFLAALDALTAPDMDATQPSQATAAIETGEGTAG